MERSRTANSLKNSTVALCFFTIDFFLKFFSRSIFLNILGDEIMGLNSTMMNLLQFLNLAELGIGAAVGFTLYKPIANNDKTSINELVQLNGYLYKRIAYFITIGGVILMAFFPLIFNKITLPLWYPYATFITFLVGVILNYCINYRQIVLSASQMDYKILYGYKSIMLLKVVIQIIFVKFCNNPYIWWLIIEVVFSIISSLTLDYTVQKSFPYLNHNKLDYKKLKLKYEVVLQKIKQVFYHKISGFILNQTSPLIIYAYLSLSTVTYYTNYILITTGVTQLFNSVFNSMANSVGNLVAEENHSQILKVFDEIFCLRFFIASNCCIGLIMLISPFITIWIGSEYILPTTTLYIIIGILYITLTRTTIDAFLNAYGMYQDVYSPVIEAVLNIGLSLLLGAIFGLNGILSGTLISLFLVVFLWKPYFLFKYGFKERILIYIKLYLRHTIILLISCAIWYLLSQVINVGYSESNWSILLIKTVGFLGFFLIFFSILIITKSPILITLKRFNKL